MADISIQFHAAPDELLQLSHEIAQECGALVTGIQYHPFKAEPVAIEGLSELPPLLRRLVFSLYEPTLSVTSCTEFDRSNPDCLRLELGRIEEHELSQSWLVVRTDDNASLERWRIAAKLLRQRTHAGVVARNRNTGQEVVMKAFRYSERAMELQQRGVEMLPPQGRSGPQIRLGTTTG